ncbi:helix-turn-helix domain-containing protein [Cohnella cellulosilytica]|uniref:Helix-turn-helix domain-containing protein n=1 Tax=Cohnella cellulosilytica TaxID=986710 RepID=A0ABW2FJ71_9BACL
MKRVHAGLIERIELQERFFLNYGIRHSEFYCFHAHQGMELLLVHEGAGQVIVGDQLVHAQAGTLLLFQPYQLHKVHMRSDAVYERSVFLFDPAELDSRLDAFPSLQRFFRVLWRNELSRQHFPLGEHAEAAIQALAGCAQTLQGADRLRRLEEMSLAGIALLQLLRRLFPEIEELASSPSRPRAMGNTEKAMQWIEAHYHEEFQLNRLADELFVSPSHLSRLFHQETGATLTEYMTARRLREAGLLLSATRLPVREIAERIGLTNVAYFGKLFRRNFGMTPVQYRNQAQNREK